MPNYKGLKALNMKAMDVTVELQMSIKGHDDYFLEQGMLRKHDLLFHHLNGSILLEKMRKYLAIEKEEYREQMALNGFTIKYDATKYTILKNDEWIPLEKITSGSTLDDCVVDKHGLNHLMIKARCDWAGDVGVGLVRAKPVPVPVPVVSGLQKQLDDLTKKVENTSTAVKDKIAKKKLKTKTKKLLLKAKKRENVKK